MLTLANNLIAQSSSRSKGPLTCSQTTPGSVHIVQWEGLPEEIDGLTSAIAFDVSSERREAGDFLVLVNRREVGYRIRAGLEEAGVPARSFFQDDALRRSNDVAASFALLRLLVEPSDRVSLRVLLGRGDSTSRADAYARVREAALKGDVSEQDLLDRVVAGEEKLGVRAIVDAYRELTARLVKLAPMAPLEVIEDLFPGGNVDAQLIRELAVAALEGADELGEVFEEMLRSITQPEVPQRPDFVRVMSLHKSKGLTSPVVVIATAIAHVIPTIRDSLSEGEKAKALEEGRRLFYVALTRCSDELVISSPFRMVLSDALTMGVAPGRIWQESGEKVTRVMATPYLAELGPTQPGAIRGDEWLAARTR